MIATEHYEEVSLAVDVAGIAHVAAVGMYRDSPDGVTSDGIFYLTNSSGSWTRERVTIPLPGGDDGQPSIAIRADGSIAIAFARFGGLQCAFGCNPVDPQGIFLVTNRAGSWSDAVPIVEGRVQQPSLQATEGRLHFAYSRGEAVPPDLEYGDEDRTVEYAYIEDDAETWAIETVGEGQSPSLRIGRDGFARIAYRDRGYDPIYAARGDSGFVVDRLPGEWLVYDPLLALDATDEPTIVMFSDQDDPLCGTVSVRRTAGNWSEPSMVFAEDEFCQLRVAGIVNDSDGTLHVISNYNLTSMGVWYANDAGGEFRARQLRDLGGRSISDIADGDSGIAVDGLGRPHILYVVRESRRGVDDGVWHGIGPAQ